MNKKFKNQKGVISVFALMAMIFFLLFILGTYMTVSRNNRIQKESNKEILKLYSSNISPQSIYNSMIASADEVIPIYTYDQVKQINSTNFYAIDGKIYWFGGTNSSYELKSNLILLNSDIDNSDKKYVDTDSLLVLLDGVNNSGSGHNANYKGWNNLVNTASSFKFYENLESTESTPKWFENGISLDGSGDHLRGSLTLSNRDCFTYEMVFKKSDIKPQRLIGIWRGGRWRIKY